jgi:hypothetical protein
VVPRLPSGHAIMQRCHKPRRSATEGITVSTYFGALP